MAALVLTEPESCWKMGKIPIWGEPTASPGTEIPPSPATPVGTGLRAPGSPLLVQARGGFGVCLCHGMPQGHEGTEDGVRGDAARRTKSTFIRARDD